MICSVTRRYYVLLVVVIACLSAVSTASVSKEAGRVLTASVPGLNQAVASKTKWTTKLIQNIKLRVGNQSPGDAFKILQLDKMGVGLFSSPGFFKWEKIVRKAEQNAPETAMFSILATHYTDDVLATMFAAAKEVDSTRSIAAKLERIQLSNWESAGKSSTYVFKALKLHKTGDNLFESPLLSTWTTYVTRTRQSNTDKSLFITLAEQYGDVAIAKMIAAAAMVDSSAELAIKLRAVQFQYWYGVGGTPITVNKLIGMAANSDDLTKKVARDFRKFYRNAKRTGLQA